MTFKTLPKPPTVETKAATAITPTSATLNRSVNPNGGEGTECKFEYGTTTSYGSSATCAPSPGSGTSPVAVSASITGLAANTTYHFRISVTNAGGTSTGVDATFTTNPPTVETRAASGVTTTSAALNGAVNPNGSEVTDCHFEYGTTTSYGSNAACTPSPGKEPVTVSASVTGLSANTAYHFGLVGTSASGTSQGSDVTFTTPPLIPHYYVNGMRLKEGTANTKTFIAWGAITLKGTKGSVLGGHITCHTAEAGTLLNPEGGGAGEGLTQVFAPFACEQKLICPSKTTHVELKAESVPWHNVLTEELVGTIRQETTGVKVGIVCFEGNTKIAETKFVNAEKEKGRRPKTMAGTKCCTRACSNMAKHLVNLNLKSLVAATGRSSSSPKAR